MYELVFLAVTLGLFYCVDQDDPSMTLGGELLMRLLMLVEAYRQLSGTAEDGVNGIEGKQTDSQTCVVNGTGGTLSTTGTLVLVSDD